MIDPFDKVLLLKYIDNAILTSFRTLSKQNNVISHTLKVVHSRFTPTGMNKHIQKMYRKAHSALYPVSEAEGDAASSGDELQEEALVRQILSKQAASRPNARVTSTDLARLQNLVDGGRSREQWQPHPGGSGEDLAGLGVRGDYEAVGSAGRLGGKRSAGKDSGATPRASPSHLR